MYHFESYQKANTVKEAIAMLQENPKARLIAGGTDVLIRLREGKKEFEHLVDIHDVVELKSISKDQDGNIQIGSGVNFTQLTESDVILNNIPLLAIAVETIGGPQIRNMATIGGNICNGVPSADSASSLFVLNARVSVAGGKGQKEMSISDLYLGPGKVNLVHDEVLTGFTITPENYKGYHGHFIKYAMRNAMDIATIGCAALLKLNHNEIEDLRLCFGVAGPVPLRCIKTETMASGKQVDQKLIKEIQSSVLDDLNPRDSWRASKEFRVQIIKELSGRVIKKAVENAGGSIS